MRRAVMRAASAQGHTGCSRPHRPRALTNACTTPVYASARVPEDATACRRPEWQRHGNEKRCTPHLHLEEQLHSVERRSGGARNNACNTSRGGHARAVEHLKQARGCPSLSRLCRRTYNRAVASAAAARLRLRSPAARALHDLRRCRLHQAASCLAHHEAGHTDGKFRAWLFTGQGEDTLKQPWRGRACGSAFVHRTTTHA